VLVLAGVELIFFTVASMRLCFGFVLKTVSIIGKSSFLLSSAYTVSRPFLLLTPPHQRVGWGCIRSWEGTQPGQLTPADQRDVPYRRMSCSAYKAEGRRRKGRTLSVMAFDGICLPKQPLRLMEPCFPGDGRKPAC